jgi:hypothetical protein
MREWNFGFSILLIVAFSVSCFPVISSKTVRTVVLL